MPLLRKKEIRRKKFEDYFSGWKPKKASFVKSMSKFVFEIIKVVFIFLVFFIPTHYFLIQPFYVKGISMQPNFQNKDWLIIDELSYRLRDPQRGETVVFRNPNNPRRHLIKRIIGLPGETIEIEDGQIKIYNFLYPQGVTLQEFDYLDSSLKTSGSKITALGEGEYFFMGDNRNGSSDSRDFGAVEKDFFVGRAWLRGLPFNKATVFELPEYNL